MHGIQAGVGKREKEKSTNEAIGINERRARQTKNQKEVGE